MHNDHDVIEVRKGEDFDREKVKAYLMENLNLPDKPMEVKQFPSGSSNLTYLIRIGDWEAVLRRPPFGPLPPKAHDMKRESSFLSKLHPEFNLVPKPYVLCEDESIIGAPFYVMERKRGIVLNDKFPEGADVTEETGADISRAFIETLVKLHDVDYKKAGLDEFGYPEGFLERQVQGWTKRFLRVKTDDTPRFDEISKWLADHMPKSHYISVIHNDYKLNNMLLTPDFKQVVAVFDWEMATIADPLFDLGIALGYWVQNDDPDFLKQVLPTVTFLPGFYTRRQLIEIYADKTNRNVDDIHYYIVFAYFKLAGILQQIYYRYKMGQTQDERFATYGERAKNLIQYAAEISNKQSY